MSFPTEEEHAAAVKAALEAAGAVPYDVDDLPAARPAYYTEVMVSRRFGGEPRGDGSKGTEGYRIETRQVAKTVTNARLLRTKTSAGLERASLVVGGLVSTPIDFENADPIAPDDGWFSGLQRWTYTV